MQTIAIDASTLLALDINALVALYNAESRRLAGSLQPHLVDVSCKPGYIVGRLARLSVYYQMARDTASNESAAMLSQPLTESAEKPATKAESARESAPLNGVREFRLMK